MDKIMPNPPEARPADQPRGDIVSGYPKIVGFFVFLQLIGWACTIVLSLVLNSTNNLIVYTFADTLFPIDISMCQLM